MTINDFLAELKDVLAKPGYVPYCDNRQLRIRSKEGDCFCPLTLLYFDRYKEYVSESQWPAVASRFEMSQEDARDIVIAADNTYGRLRPHLANAMFPVKKKFWF